MKIRGAVETIENGEIAYVEAEAKNYAAGYVALHQGLQEGTRPLNMRVDRG
ncbi:hypothetical protein ART_3423 [Arthrobacter sp. PAMC 25486]|uniref:hypothetical protein n=1 Tax=Arthrobacter sp. PAMC 25486 TaxID=1494608 RepID=UPI000536144E|nr:hypothetical protein [Arthrobacter sp. PAMC 25486]AIY03022.1 hypothetical protein ART_3423 [Arthrobacter sp. PAMC 25486]